MIETKRITKLLNSDVPVYEMAINAYGMHGQLLVAIEEMSELQKELCKEIRGKANMDNITEEMADVTIMLYQLLMIYGNARDVEKVIEAKDKRLAERLLND